MAGLNFMNSVKVTNPNKSVFDLTHDVKLSCNMGYLVPAMVFDAVPGDKFDISNEALIRFAPLVSPMYHRVNVTMHTWAVPYRILWDGYSDWFTQTKDDAGNLPAFPTMSVHWNGSDYTPLLDYLGVPNPTILGTPPVGKVSETISAMRAAAYQCVYNEFYRDENLIDPVFYKLDDGDNDYNLDLRLIRKRAWGHDYFTSNLPFAQKGDPVKLPISLRDSPVYRDRSPDTGTPPGEAVSKVDVTNVSFPTEGSELWIDNIPTDDIPAAGGLYAENSSATASTTINDLRLAEVLQKYLERAARSGTRLVEWIKGMFGVTLPDYTAQRPQYIGGSKTPVSISEVLNTTGTAELPQGNMSGRAISAVQGKNGKYVAREHCVIITLMSVMPETTYQQGLDRDFLKFVDAHQYLNPMFAHLGEQETSMKEIMAYVNGNDTAFGYLPRYSEYRTIPNRVAGDFRSSLSYWTMSRIFAPDLVHLNKEFIECDATHRVFADTNVNDQKLFVHILNRVRAVRPLPKYGTPSL